MTNEPTIRVFEVGPRDGLQNVARNVSVEQKIALIERLVAAGVCDIEIGSFVHPRWIPQMAETDRVALAIEKRPGVRYWSLVPNERGYERARAAGADHIAVVMSATKTHNVKNLNRRREESLAEIRRIIAMADADRIVIRAYLSTAFGCPYEGPVPFEDVLSIVERLFEFGASEVSLGDTIGIATPAEVKDASRALLARFTPERVALHLHDTRGVGPVNAYVALTEGITTLDSSIGGLGGCPYAPGAAGNLGTEDLVHLAHASGFVSGIELDDLVETSAWLEESVGLTLASKYYRFRSASLVARGGGL